ncbi:TetR family transcriptional regulator C-terminal domain-containing protein [Flavobacterium granuli]|uniref:AcrR family transcriptional regulator n=1 Tax=Flavobacterium granuli TaxID=280093 RepID=A0A1M5J0V7_9FLAO|nr:TetR family transcriptional regulator C-terminal domain-containing protein [Flavobacterium granuli]PRZ28190.1 AcrR family transcriptional regulator [Flavobacterium granuli]SHG34172.1 DNA-binding transcriptional regulator, AcrR family [Flavobacterium granuli]
MATKKSKITKDSIVSMFMNYTLEQGEKPKSVYQFSKLNEFTEAEFYSFFGNLESIEKEIYNLFFEKTVELLNKDTNYDSYDMKSKLLSFYFTFFELLVANRSYVSMSLKEDKNQLKNLLQLSGLRNHFKKFIGEITTDEVRIQQEKIQDFQEKAIQESAWVQFLFTLKFWLEDGSANFEKTDIYIEKSVKLSFELMNVGPINSLIDFGKFIFKEKIQNK